MPRRSTEVLSSSFHAPSELAQRLFYVVLRAGHLQCAPSYRIARKRYPGHDLLLCTDGAGVVSVGERAFTVSRGQVAWLDCAFPHAHEPHPQHPWTLRWIRLDGPLATATARALTVTEAPVFTPTAGVFEEMVVVHERMTVHLQRRPADLDARLHSDAAVLVARLVAVRQAENPLPRDSHGGGVARVLACLSSQHQKTHTTAELARIAGMSPAQLFRRFRRVTGSTPQDWLRGERLRHAQRLLLETENTVHEIAFAVGYRDPFYFSRDFRKQVGVPPTVYRRAERSR